MDAGQTCLAKTNRGNWYYDMSSAQEAVDSINRQFRPSRPVVPYRCTICSKYHIGKELPTVGGFDQLEDFLKENSRG